MINNIEDISAIDDRDIKPYKSPKLMETSNEIYYADIECDTSKEHEAYCISFMKFDETKPTFLYGKNCLYRFLNLLPKDCVVYFHNLGYDICAFYKFLRTKALRKGRKMMTATLYYNKKTFTFKDSLSLIPMKLEKFPKTFNITNIKKEVFPYQYYTFQRLTENHGIGLIDEAGNEEFNWDQDQFVENIDSIEGCRLSDTRFNMIKYVEFYCNQDVMILKEGFNKFREMCLDELQIDINQVLTAPSLANIYFSNNLYSQVNDYYNYGGVVRAFIQRAVYGGRCMIRNNEKWKVEGELYDFDAVSLYPSAMNRLALITGTPQCLTTSIPIQSLLSQTCGEDEQPNPNKPFSAFVVEIEITKINKHRHFPLIVYKENHINRNDDRCKLPIRMTVDNITLEDLVKYQQIEGNVIRGYVWTGKKSFLIREVIQKLFNLRLQYKEEENPLQEVIKLIMNSCYGKTIQKPIMEQEIYLTEKKLIPYLIKNNSKIKEVNQINENLYVANVGKSIDTYIGNTLLGVQILSMSKRIMNEVICLGEDNHIKVFYQDTDSMHVLKHQISLLEEKFKDKYNRVLVGNQMGQFHNDFDELKDGYAYKAIFVGKKCYCDLLKNDKNQKAIHYRMKGVDLDCVKLVANERIEGETEYERIFGLYEELYQGKPIEFNLSRTRTRMTITKQQRMINKTNMIRCLIFKGNKRVYYQDK